ncbi:hypothetical protein MML48_5g00002968 [Holotrichia oblita]|uniref:Uncharacterized protein n=1 Tax=Holotrichia oblita TaxID=644536 RepID=A0ACB9T4I8_HOLOL|nr:hypothetical protein MML48_5g00002968 [Holotrichia oblita]
MYRNPWKMKRNEFLMRLATENKLAIVSDDVAVIQLPYDYESAIPKRTVSFTSQSQLNNNSTAPLRDLLPNISKCVELQEPQLTQSLTSVSTTPENASADGTFSPTGRENKTMIDSTSPKSKTSSIIPDSEDDNMSVIYHAWPRSNSEEHDDDSINLQNRSSESEYLPSDEIHTSTDTNTSFTSSDTANNVARVDRPLLTMSNNKNLVNNEKITVIDPENDQSSRITLQLPATAETFIGPSTTSQYIKKPSARERPTLCPICFQDVITHFTRHLFRHHGKNENVKTIQKLKPGSKQRLALVAALRKQGYFHLKTEKDILNPVRTSTNPETEYFICIYCLGHYNKKLLYKHVKKCKNKPDNVISPGRNCLSKSQTFMASVLSKNHEYLKMSRIKKEVFAIMRADNISAIAKSDPLICLYGETLLAKHKRQQIANVVSNKIREMARMLIVLKTMNEDIVGLFDVLKPEMFRALISAIKVISGYDESQKSFRSPSLALHMGTNLKIVCDVAFKIVIEKRELPNIKWDNRDEKKSEIKDLKKLIEGHWCSEVSSLAQKTLKERQWEKPVELPLTSDILTFQTYINDLAENAYKKLNNEHNEYKDIRINYKILTECVLAHTVMFNRKRIGDVQLPQDIFQTAKVAKVLLLLEKGKGKEFRGKSLSEIELGRDAYYSSESDEDDTLSSIRPALEDALNPTTSTENESLQQEDIRNNKEFEKVIEHLEEGIEGNFSAIQPADISTEDEEAGKSVTTKAIIKKGPDNAPEEIYGKYDLITHHNYSVHCYSKLIVEMQHQAL